MDTQDRTISAFPLPQIFTVRCSTVFALVVVCILTSFFALALQSCGGKTTTQNASAQTTSSQTSSAQTSSAQTSSPLPPRRGEIIAVRVSPVQQSTSVENIHVSGMLSVARESRLGFKIGGVIGKIMVSEGDMFKKGQTLATLNTTEITAQTEQARIGLEKAQRDYDRVQSLYNDHAVTQEQWQNAKTALDAAKKNLDIATFNRRYATIIADSDGFVAKKIANEGEVLAPGAPVLAIGETGTKADWIIKAGVSDTEWSSLQLNQRATVQFDAFPGRSFDAFISRKARAADLASGSFVVELTVKFRNENVALGMFAKATIAANAPRTATTIPYDALIEANGNEAFVFVPNGNGVVKKTITIESFNQNSVIVRSGLENVREIVVSNSAFLNEQSQISIIK